MGRYSAVIFDFYGTLAYISERRNAYKLFLSEAGFSKRKKFDAQELALTTAKSMREIASMLITEKEVNVSKYEKMLKAEVESVRLYPDTLPVLDFLKKGKYKLGLLSNTSSAFKEPYLSLGLDKYFDAAVFSCDLGIKKPQKEIFEFAMELMGKAKENTLVVGDSIQSDILGAKSAGIEAVLLEREKFGTSGFFSLRDVVKHITS